MASPVLPPPPRRLARGRLPVLLASGVLSVFPVGAPAQGAGAEWTTPAGTVQGTRFSALADITSANVSTLVEEFSYPTGVAASHQGQPLVVGATMYVVTPYPNRLIALDLAHPGTARWTYTPAIDQYARGVACCDVVNRGAVYADGKIIYNLLDDNTVAVNATTGKQVWKTRLGSPTSGETLTGAPIVAGTKVIVGNAGGEMGVRGWVQALDLATGKPVWKAYATGPDADVLIGNGFHAFYAKDRGPDLGTHTWPGTLWQQGGGTSWAWITYDPALNLVYYGTANPGTWNPDLRPGDNKWGATIFARNPDTGAAAWAYQLTPHDGWDFDAVNESVAVDLKIGGVTRQVVVHFNKNGFAYTMDRATGEVISANKFAAHVTWADHVDLATGAPVVNAGMQPHQGVVTSGICPSPLGGKDWEPSAYSPSTKLFYIPAIDFCQNLEPLKANYIMGTPFTGNNSVLVPGGATMGELVAWNPATGARAWSVPETLPIYSGVLATAGNLVFYGTLDNWFKAVDATTGKVLLQKQMECGIVGSPISYTAPDGKQRIAVYTGTGWLAGGFAGAPCPDVVWGGDNARSNAPASPLASAIADLHLPAVRGPAGAAPKSGAVHVFKLP